MNLREGRRKIVVVQERLPSCVIRQSGQGFLRREIRVVRALHRCARIRRISTAPAPTAASAAACSRSAGSNRLQAPDIDGVEGCIRMPRGGYSSAQLRFVLESRFLDAAAEIDHGLLLLDQRKIVREARQSLETLIRIKDVVV